MSTRRRHGVLAFGHCLRCGGKALYSTYENDARRRGYDATFCDACDIWLESRCLDATCEYCADRPARPSMVKLERLLMTPIEHEPAPPSERPADVEGGRVAASDPQQQYVSNVLRLPRAKAQQSHVMLRIQERSPARFRN